MKRMANVPFTKDDIALTLFLLEMAKHAEVGEDIKERYAETVEHIRKGVLEAERQLDRAEKES